MKKKLIISTPIKETWGDRELIFLGEWCKKFSESDIWNNKDFETLTYHWQNPRKIDKDNLYLEGVYEKLLESLVINLNAIHEVNLSLRAWRIIIGPWLLTFVSTLWDRWEVVNTLINTYPLENLYFKRNKNYQINPPNDYEQSLRQFGDDYWNEVIFSKLLVKKNISYEDISLDNVKTNKLKSNKNNTRLLESVSYFFQRPKTRRKLTIFHAYFPKSFMFLLNLRLKMRVRMDSYFNLNLIYSNTNSDHRSKHKINSLDDDSFEGFVSSQLFNYIPKAYLEDFKKIYAYALSIPRSELIHTANAHFGNEIFKTWAALNCEKGSKLIISSHGGAIYPKYSVFDHQEKISDERIIWGMPWLKGQRTLPPNKLSFKIKNINQFGFISFIDNDSMRYSYRCMSASQGPLVKKSFSKSIKFLELLAEKSDLNIRIKPKYSGDNETALMYEKIFGKEVLLGPKTQMKDIAKNSKLIICSYPQTAYAEAMYSGVPTLLVYDQEIWSTQSIYNDLIVEMTKNKMIFSDPLAAAEHVINLNENIILWWHSDEIIKVREKFNEMCITFQSKKLDNWLSFFKEQISFIADKKS